MAAPAEKSAAVALATDVPTDSDAAPSWSPEALLAAEPVALAAQLADEDAAAPIAGWSDEQAAALVTKLKDGADRHWLINPNRSLEMADAILRIGRTRGDTRTTALGIMARADAMKLLGHSQEAWDAFQEAGRLFQEAGDEVGWARTRIGPLFLCVKLNRVDEALHDAATARAILEVRNEDDVVVRLDFNAAHVCYERGDHESSLRLYEAARATAESRDSSAKQFLAVIYTNIGAVYCDLLGNYTTALDYFNRAREVAITHSETKSIALANIDIAFATIEQGHYKRALQILYDARRLLESEGLTHDATTVDRIIVECYLQLNRYADARELARVVVSRYQTSEDHLKQAETLVNLAVAEAEMGHWPAAEEALRAAADFFDDHKVATWAAITRLWRGMIARRRGDTRAALAAACEAATWFETAGHAVYFATALLLQAETTLADGDCIGATSPALRALTIARANNTPSLRYGGHLTLGQIAESRGDLTVAVRHYRAANAVIDRMQRGLSLTLRPGFLMDKGEAIRRQLALLLEAGDAPRAFDVLERAKSQALLNSVNQRQRLRWKTEDAETQRLIDELERLRDQHRWLFRLAHEDLTGEQIRPSPMSHQNALLQLSQCERRMRAITEQLYLRADDGWHDSRTAVLSLPSLRGSLDEDSVLIEFYHDESALYAFTLDAHSLEVRALPVPFATVERLLAQLQLNIATTLRQDAHSPAARALRGSASRLLAQLFAALLEPVASAMRGRRRLYIVPYGMLHYLPFHLLRANDRYLIEDYEVVILPSAGLLTRSAPVRNGGAHVIAHSANGLLPQVPAEAAMVETLFSGDVRLEEAANREAFETPPTQILHVAAHAAFRLDQPDLSYIELADGQLYADDLMQQDLSYELVTLSACETGRTHVAPRDELIGLGRGFLYAGAGSLIASLWRVADDIALPLMRHMYEELRAGASKAGALRAAQRAILAEDPDLHPAYWGPFQLTGDAGPLSSPRRDVRRDMLREELVAR